MRKLTYILRALKSPKKIIQALSYITNDEVYWDAYVSDWRKSSQGKELTHLGNEWKNEEIFLSILETYSADASVALEIGCGGGRITSKAARLFQKLYAADISSKMLRECQRSVSHNNVSFHKIDGYTLHNFEENSIDVVFAHDVFVHFSSLQLYPYFQEIKRVLKNGGLGILSFYNFIRHFDLFKEMSIRYHTKRTPPPHMRVHFITEEMLRTILNDLNLEIVEIDKTNFLIVVFRNKSGGV